jgi:YVTN family beta-propeller protein
MFRSTILATELLLTAVPTASAGNSLLAASRDGKTVLATNRDNDSVSVVDVATRKVIREIPVGRLPESVAWIGDGPLAVVTAYLEDAVAIIDTSDGKLVKKIPIGPEPYGVVVDKAGKRAYVTNEYPGVVTVVDLDSRSVVNTIAVGPFVRGLALSNDEKLLYVTHFYTAAMSAVDLASGAVVDHWKQQSAADNLARQVAVHPTKPYAYLPHLRSRTTQAHGAGSIFPYLTVLDLVPPSPDKRRRHPVAMDQFNDARVTCNPWEVAIHPDGERCYVVYAGTNDLNVCRLMDDGQTYVERPSGRSLFEVGKNPRAVACSPDGKSVFVLNALDFTLAIYDADPFRLRAEVTLCKPKLSPQIVRGMELFNLADNPMSRLSWISCSSCHPDGDHDGRVWRQPEGMRRSTHFFGMSRTTPLHWSADRDEVQDFEHTIRGPLMQGSGLLRGRLPAALGEPLAGRSKDLDALAAYCNSLEAPISPHTLPGGELSDAAKRGRALFHSEKTGCATCHSGPDFTDRKRHDVGTGRGDRFEKMGFEYDTPSLVRVYRNPSWLHDGSAPTLEAVLTNNPGDKHGRTSHLTNEERADLVAFLKSIPFKHD